ncbi:MAG: hypothetical protein EAY75_14125 [Bacteroidetes bacterium]|nr:MAG: hypothetical protein EAY75_14125 [Bacteroidota bacterium]
MAGFWVPIPDVTLQVNGFSMGKKKGLGTCMMLEKDIPKISGCLVSDGHCSFYNPLSIFMALKKTEID